MAEEKLSSDIFVLLEEACKDTINNFDIIVHDDNGGGQGYMGEMIFVSLTNKTSNKTFHLAIKQTLPASTPESKIVMEVLYFNEIHFYKTIWKELQNFQNSFPGSQFNKIAKFYCSSSDPGKEKLVLENLKYSDYKMFPRDGTFDDVHVKLLMKSYGQFHGISAAYREHYPEEYTKLTSDLKNSLEFITLGNSQVGDFILSSIKRLHTLVEDDKIKAKLAVYTERAPQMALDAIKYEGRNPVVSHGDCWSNNLMFKFDKNGIPVDMVLLDFQLCRSGSVVSDLSYLLYSGVSKEIFGNLDYYLKIYHDSFSNTLRHFNLNPSLIFTFEDLKQEWKEHCAYGFIMAQLLLGNKFSKQYEKRNFVDLTEGGEFLKFTEDAQNQLMEHYQTDVEKLNRILKDMAQHLYECDYL